MATRYGSGFDADSAARAAKRLLLGAGVLLLVVFLGCSTTTRVDAGHVGIRVKLAGSDRGVQDMPVVTGWVFYNPLTEQIVIFPTSVQNVVWTASRRTRGARSTSRSPSRSNEGVNVNADIGLSFHIEPSLAPKLYRRFRQNDMLGSSPTATCATPCARRSTTSRSKLPVQDIYGAGKSKMLAERDAEVPRRLRQGRLRHRPAHHQRRAPPAAERRRRHQPRDGGDAERHPEPRTACARSKAEAEQAITQAHGAGRGRAAEGAGRGRRAAHPRAGRGAGQRDHPPVDDAGGAPVPRARALGRQAPDVQRRGQLPLLTFDVDASSALRRSTRRRARSA